MMMHHLIIKLPNGQMLKVDVPPEALMGGGAPPPPIPPPPPQDPGGGGDDMFGLPMPEPSKQDVVEAVTLLCIKYRYHYKIADYQPFTHAQIEQVVASVRHLIYQHEGILPPKQK